jgi:hypothetical protein
MEKVVRARARGEGPGVTIGGASLTARGFDHVEVPSGDGDNARKRLSKGQFEALPLQERIGLLVQGTLRFYRGGQEVAASEAMRAAF